MLLRKQMDPMFEAFRREACFSLTTSSVTFKPNHPDALVHSVRQGCSSTAISSFSNSTKGKVKHYFIAVRTDNRHRPPPAASTSSITHCWFYKASAIRDLIWLYYNSHQRDGAINQIEEGKREQPAKERNELKWLLYILCYAPVWVS